MGRRIVRRTSTGRPVRSGADTAAPTDLGQYWERLKNLIPAEVSAIYIAGLGIIPTGEHIGLAIWALICLIFTVVFMAKESQKVAGEPEEVHPIAWIQVAISSVSFVIWAYALGGPFDALGIYVPWIGTLVILGWTFIVPFIYQGTKA